MRGVRGRSNVYNGFRLTDEKFFSEALVPLDKGSEKTDPNGVVVAMVQAALPAKTFLLLTARLVIRYFRFSYDVGAGLGIRTRSSC